MSILSSDHNLAFARMNDSLYIDGAWSVPVGNATIPVINPATGRSIGSLAVGSRDDVERAVFAARQAFPAWSLTSVFDRVAILDRIYRLILERKELLAQTITAEMGAAISFARNVQVPLAAEHIRVVRDLASTYPFLTLQGRTAISREAIGVCALITPWNWPLYQITVKVGPALAAGCTVILKPSELSPLSAALFAQLIHDAGVPPGVFNLVQGSGAEVGEALAAHDEVDMISITGSNRAGVLVARAAATSVKRVTQELGGKSPNILLPDADFAQVVPSGMMAAFRNAGQSCSAPTRMIVPRWRLAEVEDIIVSAAAEIVVGDPRAEDTILGPIANEAQFHRVQTLIEAGVQGGARIICGGPGRPEGCVDGYFAQPTVFSDVTPDMRIAQEEIFGPVLCVMPYDTIDDAIAIANNTMYGLGAHVQSRDLDSARSVALRIRSGQVHINHPPWDPTAPFGGYKRSGNGREYGEYGFEEYLETKAILGYA